MIEAVPMQSTEVARHAPRKIVDGKQVPPLSPTPENWSGLHLLIEPLDLESNSTTDARDLPLALVPKGASYLNLDSKDGVYLPSVIRLVGDDERRTPSLCFEPVDVARGPGLLMVTPPSVDRLRINGRPAPRVALLCTGDQIHLDGSCVLHVVRKRRLEVVTPPSDFVGRSCGYCRVPFVQETTIVICDCGVPRHLELPPKPDGERLECAQLTACPNCRATLPSEAGDLELPEL